MKYIILIFLITIIAGCGVTGTASKADFPLLTNTAEFKASLDSVQIIADNNTADNESYGAFNWGSFDDSDRSTIQQTIYNTLNKNTASQHKAANVHAKIHRYSQVITNASYASFVIVDWCLELDGKIITNEVFYAGHSDELNIFTGKTLGWAKGQTHKAIASRIINQTIEALSIPSIKNAYSESNIFLNANDAVKALPTKLTSVGSAGFSGGMYYYVGSQTGDTDFDKKSIYQKVNWQQEIQ